MMAQLPWIAHWRTTEAEEVKHADADLRRAVQRLREMATTGQLDAELCFWLADRIDPESSTAMQLVPKARRPSRPSQQPGGDNAGEIANRVEAMTARGMRKTEAVRHVMTDMAISRSKVWAALKSQREREEAYDQARATDLDRQSKEVRDFIGGDKIKPM